MASGPKIPTPPPVHEGRPLGLAEIESGKLPRIEVHVFMKDTTNVIEAHLNALIVSPSKRFLYLEAACSSDSRAHALMGCIADDNGKKQWQYYRPERNKEFVELTAPTFGKCSDWSATIPGYDKKLHHVAIVETQSEMLLAPNDEWLWQKLRSLMSCPTLSEWGSAVMPQIHAEGLLIPCEQFGVDVKLKPYVLSETASARFDAIIGAHVRRIGGIPERTEHGDQRTAPRQVA